MNGSIIHPGARPRPPAPPPMPLAKRVQLYGEMLARLVTEAERAGVILTVQRVSRAPAAMGNHFARVDAYASKAARDHENATVRALLAGGPQ